MMQKNIFKGLFPFFIEFNSGLYKLFNAAPSYIGKIFIGLFYGLLIGFIFSCWRDELFRSIFFLSVILWVLSLFDCITIHWEKIYTILGYSGQLSYNTLLSFFSFYCLEIGITLFVSIIVYLTVSKYKNIH